VESGWLTLDSILSDPYIRRSTETFNYRVNCEPLPGLKLDIQGNRTYAENFQQYFRANSVGEFEIFTPTNGGNFTSSTMLIKTAFTKDYGNESDGSPIFDQMLANRPVIADRIAKGKFREDLYYRLNSVPIRVPALRERPGDIYPLFVKFAADFSDKYHVPTISLTEEAQSVLRAYRWPGNVRQLKNVTEQISIIEKERLIDAETLKPYLTGPVGSNLPAVLPSDNERQDNMQREIVFKFIAELQREVRELKVTVAQLAQNPQMYVPGAQPHHVLPDSVVSPDGQYPFVTAHEHHGAEPEHYDESEVIEDAADYSMEGLEKQAIIAALRRNKDNRKLTAQELGISERTLYRKIKEYGI
jgi:DNA-binding NtrC family response regulator